MCAKRKKIVNNAPVKSQGDKIELIGIPTAPRRDGFSTGLWRQAIKMAEDVYYPDRSLLLDIYNEIMIDTHLSSVIDKRRDNIRAKKIRFDTGGKPDDRIDALIRMPWFGEMTSDVIDARFFGPTAAWCDLSGGVFHKYRMLDRRHLLPEKHEFRNRQTDRSGIDYTQPPYSNYVLTCGREGDFGLLLKAVVWVLFKRGDVSDWATFNEMFAAPFRLGKYPQYDDEAKKALARACRDSAANSWAIIPNTTDLSLIQAQAAGSVTAYEKLAEFCDKQISKAFLRNTMTLDAEGGQYKGDIHENSEKGVFASDLQYLMGFLNTEFVRLLNLHGFTIGNGGFVCEEEDHLCLTDRITIDMQVATQIEIPPSYWYDKYGYPLPEGGPKAKVNPAVENMTATVGAMREEMGMIRAQLATARKAEQERLDREPACTEPAKAPRRSFFG